MKKKTTPAQPKPMSWSISKLKDFTRCKLAFKIKHIDRVPEPERPLPKGRDEHANDRGSRIHDNIETYIRGDHDSLCPEADKHFGVHIDLLRHLYTEGAVEMEGNWAISRDWEIADWDTGWCRLKLDVLVQVGKDEAIIIDWKSGRKFGNEVSHAQQLQFYSLITFLRFPHLEVISAELMYVDVGETTRQTFTRDQSLRFKRSFNTQGVALTDCTDFPANPNRFSCQWCPWGETGHCSVSVRDVKTVGVAKSKSVSWVG